MQQVHLWIQCIYLLGERLLLVIHLTLSTHAPTQVHFFVIYLCGRCLKALFDSGSAFLGNTLVWRRV